MSIKLGKAAFALAAPLALVLIASPALAGVQRDPSDQTATKTVTKTKSGNTVTRESTVTRADGKTATRESTTVKDGNTVTRQTTATGPNGGTTVATSIHDWQPGATTRTTTRTTKAPAGTRSVRATEDVVPRERAVEVNDKK